MLEFENINIVVSTVGLWVPNNSEVPQMVNSNGYFETMVFEADDSKYKDADISKKVFDYQSSWYISEIDEIKANQMHENMVSEMIMKYHGK